MDGKVWSTQTINEVLDKLRFNMQGDMSCFYERDIELKAGNIFFKLTQAEVEEFDKCSNDIIYFVENYCKFLTDWGRIIVKLRPKQIKILKTLAEQHFISKLDDYGAKNRNVILMASRQTGKTTTVAAFFAWYLCFHIDRNLAILANKQTTTIEIVSKVIEVFKGLPFFLKPGILNIGALGMRLDNGCQLFSQATTMTAQIGFTLHVLYADEFAHIQHNIVNKFWKSVYPTLSSSLISQCIISSTPEGTTNKFYDIWDKANRGENSFVPIRVDYWEVPDHDDAWVEQMKKDYGEEEFAQEFELQFNISSRLLMGAKSLGFMSKIQKEYIFNDLERTSLTEELYRNLKWHPLFDPNQYFNPSTDKFILTIDTGEGKDEEEKKDNDFNVINIFKLKLKSLAALRKLRKDQYQIQNMIRLVQVGLYRDNFQDETLTGKVTKAIAFDQLGAENCKIFVEMNFNGKLVLKEIMTQENFFPGMVLHTHHTKPIPGEKAPRKKPGFKVRIDKEHFCKLGKKYIDEKLFVINNPITVNEFSNFGKNKRGSLSGLSGSHDDTVMATLNLARGYEEDEYILFLNEFIDDYPDCPEKTKINELLAQYEDTDASMSDDMFKALYGNNSDGKTPTNELSWLNQETTQRQLNILRYNPSSTMKFKN
jgi:hypothetical protein